MEDTSPWLRVVVENVRLAPTEGVEDTIVEVKGHRGRCRGDGRMTVRAVLPTGSVTYFLSFSGVICELQLLGVAPHGKPPVYSCCYSLIDCMSSYETLIMKVYSSSPEQRGTSSQNEVPLTSSMNANSYATPPPLLPTLVRAPITSCLCLLAPVFVRPAVIRSLASTSCPRPATFLRLSNRGSTILSPRR